MTEHTGLPAKILVVDDNPANLKLLVEYLTRAGFKALIANDGEGAIQQIHRFPPDLILLDVLMPGIDGFETCQRLKSDRATQEIPIIFMTALTDTAEKVKGFDAGAVDYVTKPFQQEELLARINTHLTLRNLQKNLQAEVAQRRKAEETLRQQAIELQERNQELQEALAKVKTLSGLLPICANCKKIRNDEGYWEQVDVYLRHHSDAEFSHGICPDCMQELYSEYFEKKE
jgi:DNA-binding response OmpR family regulator